MSRDHFHETQQRWHFQVEILFVSSLYMLFENVVFHYLRYFDVVNTRVAADFMRVSWKRRGEHGKSVHQSNYWGYYILFNCVSNIKI